jgi:HK97 family phage portal protein
MCPSIHKNNPIMGLKLKNRIDAFLNPAKRTFEPALKGPLRDFVNNGSDSGVSVNEESSLKFSAVWLARRILSELPASLEIEVFELSGKNRNSIDHPIKYLLNNPNSKMNGFTYHELMNDWLQGWGNGVSVINNRRTGHAETLMPVHPSCVSPVISKGQVFYIIADNDMGVYGTFFPEEVLHYKLFTTNGLWGRDPILMARDNVGLGLAAEKFGAKFFKKGGNLKAVVETTGHMSDVEFKEWKKRWDAYYSGEEGDHSTPVLEYGMQYKPLGIPPEAAQYLQTRQFSIQDIARWFNLPPHMLGDLSRSTFSNVEQQDLSFVKYTLRPILKRQETELESKLLLPSEKGKYIIRFNLDGMLRGDLASVTAHIKDMVPIGVLSPNEGRRLINQNPREGGDEYYKPANITGKENPQSTKPINIITS